MIKTKNRKTQEWVSLDYKEQLVQEQEKSRKTTDWQYPQHKTCNNYPQIIE